MNEQRVAMNPEINKITDALRPHLGDHTNFLIGEFQQLPNLAGCFQRDGKWFWYETDERCACTFNGPYDLQDVITAGLKRLHVKGLRFSTDEAREIYLNNHFRTFAEIDESLRK